MSLKEATEGLNILVKYDADAEICGEHDVWLVAIPEDTISDQDKELLKSLGWSYDSEYDSWRKFT